MKPVVLLTKEAEADLEEAIAWYKAQQPPDLAGQFLDSVEDKLNLIEANPLSFPIIHHNIHRAVVSRFPYSVFYFIEDTEAVVIAIMHARRKPNRWHSR